jgi:hypothetical protein
MWDLQDGGCVHRGTWDLGSAERMGWGQSGTWDEDGDVRDEGTVG